MPGLLLIEVPHDNSSSDVWRPRECLWFHGKTASELVENSSLNGFALKPVGVKGLIKSVE